MLLPGVGTIIGGSLGSMAGELLFPLEEIKNNTQDSAQAAKAQEERQKQIDNERRAAAAANRKEASELAFFANFIRQNVEQDPLRVEGLKDVLNRLTIQLTRANNAAVGSPRPPATPTSNPGQSR